MQTIKIFSFFLILAFQTFSLFGQVLSDSTVLAEIKNASQTNSSIPKIITNLDDINGPRLLGTVNYYNSANWAKQQLKEFGADTSYFKSFDKQYRGWGVKSFNIEMTKPNYMHIVAYPLAYTKSTNGTVEGKAVYLSNPDSLKFFKGKLRGKIILLGQDFSSFNSSQEIRSDRSQKNFYNKPLTMLTQMTC